MRKKTLIFMLSTLLFVSQLLGAETIVYASEEIEDDFYSEDILADHLLGSEETELFDEEALSDSMEESIVEEDYQFETESGEDVDPDELVDTSEAIDTDIQDGIIEDFEDFLFAAGITATELTTELTPYNFSGDKDQIFLLKPKTTGEYHFVGDIDRFSILDTDGESVKVSKKVNPLTVSGNLDSETSIVAAMLKAGSEYEITISPSKVGSIYFYQVPRFCVKMIKAENEDDGFQLYITYQDKDNAIKSFKSKVFLAVQCEQNQLYYFLSDQSAIGEPVDNGDGTYSVNLKDPVTGDRLGHCWDSGNIIVQPTCGRNGSRRCTCLCGAETEIVIQKTDKHTWGSYNENGDRTCSVCGAMQHDSTKVKPQISGKPQKVKVKAAGGRKLVVSWKKPSKSVLKNIKGYYIEVATDSAFTNIVKTKSIKKKKTSFTFKKLQKKKKYYVRVRFYNGSKFSQWSAVKSRKVK